MTDDYLKATRKQSHNVDVTASELELIFTREDIKSAWQELHAIKEKMADEKVKAVAEVDARYKDELESAVSNYAFLLAMTRS